MSIPFQVHSPTKLVAPSEPELQDNLPGSSKNPIILKSDGEGLEKQFRGRKRPSTVHIGVVEID